MTTREPEDSARPGRHEGRAETELTSNPVSVAQAARSLAGTAAANSVPPAVCDTAVLLTSEVVTNAFLHGRSNARLSVHTSAGRVRVEVGDDNVRPPHLAEIRPDATNGRGLLIVDTLAAEWGVNPTEHGKSIWFEIPVAPPAPN